MKALKVAAIALLAVIAAGVAALFVGVPAGFLLTPIQERIEADTGYELKVAGATKLTYLQLTSLTTYFSL